MKIIKPGQYITIIGGLKVQVNGVRIGAENHIMYEVSWWASGNRQTAMIYEFEIEDKNPPKTIQMGFIKD